MLVSIDVGLKNCAMVVFTDEGTLSHMALLDFTLDPEQRVESIQTELDAWIEDAIPDGDTHCISHVVIEDQNKLKTLNEQIAAAMRMYFCIHVPHATISWFDPNMRYMGLDDSDQDLASHPQYRGAKNYPKRKRLNKQLAIQYGTKHQVSDEHLLRFKAGKGDDYADAYLQGLAFITLRDRPLQLDLPPLSTVKARPVPPSPVHMKDRIKDRPPNPLDSFVTKRRRKPKVTRPYTIGQLKHMVDSGTVDVHHARYKAALKRHFGNDPDAFATYFSPNPSDVTV